MEGPRSCLRLEGKGKFPVSISANFSFPALVLLFPFLPWVRGTEPRVIMMGPNCRVINNNRKGEQREKSALLKSPLERWISEIKILHLHNTPDSSHGNHSPGHNAMSVLNATALIVLSLSNSARWHWGRRMRRAAELNYSRWEKAQQHRRVVLAISLLYGKSMSRSHFWALALNIYGWE